MRTDHWVFSIDDYRVVVFRRNMPPFIIRESSGRAYELYLWLNTDTKLSYDEFIVALKEEVTCVITA